MSWIASLKLKYCDALTVKKNLSGELRMKSRRALCDRCLSRLVLETLDTILDVRYNSLDFRKIIPVHVFG